MRSTTRAKRLREIGALVMSKHYYSTKGAALALADRLHEDEVHGWTYEVHACARGFYVAVFDDDGHFMGTL